MESLEDHDFLVVRKNLNILSVVILVLAFTNAKIDVLSILGISVTLDGSKFYVVLWVGYLYFLWRFLTKCPFVSGFWTDFLRWYLEGEGGVTKQHNFQRYMGDIVAKNSSLQEAIASYKETKLMTTRVVRLSPTTRKLRLSLIFYVPGPGSGVQNNNLNIDYDFVASRFLVVRKLVVFSLKYDKFGDYLFPLVLVFINLLFFLLKQNWAGSMYGLFSRKSL